VRVAESELHSKLKSFVEQVRSLFLRSLVC
jgi:hypothetical protein